MLTDFINKMIVGDCFEVSAEIPDKSLDLIVTSPPYWSQRKYTESNLELGQEPYVWQYVQNLESLFLNLSDKLKDSGSLWINIGDTYYGGSKGVGGASIKQDTNKGSKFSEGTKFNNKEFPNKSLCNIPSRLSVQLQDRGLILRNTIIWHKPNVWVTSAKDRFTVDFEYFFWFVKDSSEYYFEQQFEPYLAKMNRWGGQKLVAKNNSEWDKGTGQSSYRDRDMRPNSKGRNKRTVWSINTKPVKGLAHFAKYPEELIETPIKACCPIGGVVLDPFMGSGTTAVVCKKLGRNYIGIDISEEYVKMAKERLNG